MSEAVAPPIYSQEDPQPTEPTEELYAESEPQIVIVPTATSTGFQTGYLGTDSHAAIEGELRLKGTSSGSWGKVVMALRSVEQAYGASTELGSSEVVLFSSALSGTTVLPTSLPFSIPLTEDTPQSIQTPVSSLSHSITATIYPSNPGLQALSKTTTVHTRRYTAPQYIGEIAPETHSLDAPTRVEVQLPRRSFRAEETIPIYVTIPPPTPELVVQQGLRLRNVRAELVRVVKVNRLDEEELSDSDAEMIYDGELVPSEEGPSTSATLVSVEKARQPSSSTHGLDSPLFQGASYKTVVARSGASCRFHSTLPVRLRFILHQPTTDSPSNFPVDLPTAEYGQDLDSDPRFCSITQTTLMHTVSFQLNVHVSFVDTATRRESISTVTIPISIVGTSASILRGEDAMDAAYQKKHDRPPARTNRHVDPDPSIPHYDAGEAGPSALPVGAPPPFEERDEPPPFHAEAEGSSSSRLPSFFESETEVIDALAGEDTRPAPRIAGEGHRFGFNASQQFDGHLEDTNPPIARPREMVVPEPSYEPEPSMEALGLTLNPPAPPPEEGEAPPPPPDIDDPSDPPPSIDSDNFRSPALLQQDAVAATRLSPPSAPPAQLPPIFRTAADDPPPRPSTVAPGLPPPYLIPVVEHVVPPPYVDLVRRQ